MDHRQQLPTSITGSFQLFRRFNGSATLCYKLIRLCKALAAAWRYIAHQHWLATYRGIEQLEKEMHGLKMTEKDFTRRLSAILSADVKGFTELMRNDELGTLRRLNHYRDQISNIVEQHHGRIVDSPGDNILTEFASVVNAVMAAVAIQKQLKSCNTTLPANRKMEFRIGINLGDIIVEDDRIYGDSVNMAARLEAISVPGGICISRAAFDQIEGKLPFGYEYLGEIRLTKSTKPLRAYKVLFEAQHVGRKIRQWTAKQIKVIKTPAHTDFKPFARTNEAGMVIEEKGDWRLFLAYALTTQCSLILYS